MKPIHLRRVRVSTSDEYIFIAADGETHEDGVRETLDGIAQLSEAFTASGVAHEVFERKRAGGGYEPDTIKLSRGKL